MNDKEPTHEGLYHQPRRATTGDGEPTTTTGATHNNGYQRQRGATAENDQAPTTTGPNGDSETNDGTREPRTMRGARHNEGNPLGTTGIRPQQCGSTNANGGSLPHIRF